MIRVTLALCIACHGVAQAAPFLPSEGGQVLQVVPKRSDPQQQILMQLKARHKAAPGDPAAAAALAQAYISAGRREADPRFYGYAQAAIAPWWQSASPPGEIRLLRAILRQATHQFTPALDDLKELVRSEPSNPQAWLTLATVQAVTGDYSAAIASCKALVRLAPSSVMAGCLANPYAATGQATNASAMLRVHEQQAGNDDGMKAWLAGIQGELAARLGETRNAELYYQRALVADPGEAYVLGAYADLLLDQKRYAEAVRLTQPHERIDALLLRNALGLKGLGDKSASDRAVAELGARFAAAERRGEAVHEREQSRFELHLKGQANKALTLARHNWEVQKEPADARILLEAGIAAGDRQAAQVVVEWITRHRMQDAALQQLVTQFRARRGA